MQTRSSQKLANRHWNISNSDKYQVDQDGNWSATAANNYMTTNLSQYNEGSNNMIELVICNNDGMAEGAISALNDKGYNLGTGKDGKMIPVFGVDATDAAKQLIADGKIAYGGGKCELIKMGAAASFIKNGPDVKRMQQMEKI
jgi:methyl-galactoside transport system substrate-binding protein